ncbi:MAG: bifunctional folylpolyglutamate synthase/dihydrofolate synthase [Rickettsiales bacterium]|nr:bifunctional folylpolyglutamate synthase/dihydrofolate synthase [Rickettsiales bacterium]
MDRSKKILKRLELLHPKKIDLSLNRLNKLLKKLGEPHLKIPPTIHIAGTNGKGSVTSFLRSIFETAKLNVHTYTSPHLVKFNERIRLNSKIITNSLLSSLLEECEDFNNGEEITFFEITTAAAFLAFNRNKSDLVLIETGLGGRFDATNVIKDPLCCVFTPISMDHMNFLGTTLHSIANEKLGILKKNSVTIIAKQKSLVKKLIRKEALKKSNLIYEEGKDWKINNLKKNSFIFEFDNKKYEFSKPSLYGHHQIENASTAIASVMSQRKFKIQKNSINKAIKNTSWPARMQTLDSGKLKEKIGDKFEIWLDGGHNIHAAEIISKIFDNWDDEPLILVLGMVTGKDPINFLKKLINKLTLLIILPIDDHQYIKPYEIKKNISKIFKKKIEVDCCLNINEAIELIKKKIERGRILICGSLYLAGQTLESDGYKVI